MKETHSVTKEDFMDWYYEITSKDRATHSNQLDYINKNLVNLNGYGKMWKALRTDVGLTIVVISFIMAIVTPYFLIKTDIALINQKLDRVSIDVESSIEAITKIDTRVSRIEGRLTQKTP